MTKRQSVKYLPTDLSKLQQHLLAVGPWALMAVSLFSLGLSFAGCNNQDAGQSTGPENLLDELPGEKTAGGPTAEEIPEEQRREQTLLDDEQLAAEISRLSQAANQLEAEFKFAEAVPIWNQLLELIRQRHGEESWQARNVEMTVLNAQNASEFSEQQMAQLRAIGKLRAEMGKAANERDYSRAYDIGLRISNLMQPLFGRNSYLVGRIQMELGQISSNNGQSPELILEFYMSALQIFKQQLGTLHPETESTTYRIGQVLQMAGKQERALEYFQESVQLAAKIWGEQDLTYASRCHDLGVVCHAGRKLEEAKRYIETSANIRRALLGDTHPQLAHSLRNLAVVYQDQNELETARQLYKEAIEIFMARLGGTNGFTVDAQLKLATVLSLQKNYTDAESVLAGVAQVQLAGLGPKDVGYADTLSKLGIVMCYQAKYKEAEPLLVHALQVQTDNLGQNNPLTRRTFSAYIKLLERTDRASLAAELSAEVAPVGFNQAVTQGNDN